MSEESSKIADATGWRRGLDHVGVPARWILGGLFAYLGLGKALHPVDFLKLIHEYGLVNEPLLINALAALLPWFECFCGLLLLSGVAVRGTALLSAAMLAPFTVLVWQRALLLQAALNIPFCAVRFDCGCGLGEVPICRKLLENAVLLSLSLLLFAGFGRRWSLRYTLLPEKPAQVA